MLGEKDLSSFDLRDIDSLVARSVRDIFHDVQSLFCGQVMPFICTSVALRSGLVFESRQLDFDGRWYDGARSRKAC